MTTKINNLIERFDNQYFYDEPVGVYLINLSDKVFLFDLPTYSIGVQEYLLSKGKPMFAVLSHGSCGIEDGKIWQKKLGIKVYLHKADKDHEWLKTKPDVLFSESPDLDSNISIIHTPGHSPGSVCLLEKTTKTLFTGDTFAGDTNGEVRDFRQTDSRYDDIPQRIISCKELLKYEFNSVLPFHYEMILKDADIALRKFVKNIVY